MTVSAPEKRYAYLVMHAISELRYPDLAGVDFTPADTVSDGEILLQVKNHGTGTHTFQIEDGPLVWTVTAVYICTGVLDVDDIVQFDYGAVRLLNLLKLAYTSEQTLRSTVHEVVDGIKSLLEPEIDPNTFDGIEPEKIFAKIDAYEKGLWRKH